MFNLTGVINLKNSTAENSAATTVRESSMSDPEVPVSGIPAGEQSADSAGTTQSVPIDPYRSVLRLLVGGSIDVADLLVQWLEQVESTQSELLADDDPVSGETVRQQALYVSVALLFASYETARRGIGRVAHASGRVAHFWLNAFSPARKMLGSWVENHEADLDSWIRTGRVESRRSRGLARYVASSTVNQVLNYLNGNQVVDNLVTGVAGAYLQYLEQHPEAVDGLVQEVAGNYMAYLQEHPEQVEPLVRSQGDDYIGYLNTNPEKVQDLLAGQSTGIANELVEEVRERTVSADNVFEMIARSILRRTPREQLPEPPPDVQRRAERSSLPTDLKPPEVDDDAGI
jgi:hypothetical protein